MGKAKVRHASDLAQELAARARHLRRLAYQQLSEQACQVPVRRLYDACKATLAAEQTEAEFADAFAQTLTYGLLTARWLWQEQPRCKEARFTKEAALQQLPATSPWLTDLFHSTLSAPRDAQQEGIVELADDLADLLDRADVAHIFRAATASSGQLADPILHFYEPFLSCYDRALKHQRGVFFTPRSVVSYIIRGIHERLQSEFGLEDGLASADTWGDVAKRVSSLELPPGISPNDPFVVLLDPATGTGTFLLQCVELIEQVMKARWCRELGGCEPTDPRVLARWVQYVPRHLLPRLHGYELMMAPYAIAQLKLARKLEETGYRLQADERLHVYLTNSLRQRTGLFTVLVGNPPYAKRSANLSRELRTPVARYRFVDGKPIKERGALQFEINLQDDYVKFVRFCENALAASGVGLVGLITSNGYLSAPTLRGMRNSMLETFATLWILDLHGHVAKGEVGPAGLPDENVFDILQGVAVLFACRRAPAAERGAATVWHADCYGTREEKYAFLCGGSLASSGFARIRPAAPFYLLLPHDADRAQEWRSYIGLGELFPRNSAGIVTARDELVLAEAEQELAQRIERFSQSTADESELYAQYRFAKSKRFDLRKAQAALRQLKSFSQPIIRILHRPFDERFLFFHSSVVWSMSRPMAAQLRDGNNLALVATRQVTGQRFEHAFVTRHMIELKACSHDRNTQIFPLWLGPPEGPLGSSGAWLANLQPQALARLQLAVCPPDQPGPPADFPRQVLHYVYAVLHAPEFRKRYFELLRSDFPRVPLTPSPVLFAELARQGGELVTLHLREGPQPAGSRYRGQPSPQVQKLSYATRTIWLGQDRSNGFHEISEDVWKFRVGGYQVCEKWLKARMGRRLTGLELAHYDQMLDAIDGTLRLMRDIDTTIDRHGGWPAAFVRAES